MSDSEDDVPLNQRKVEVKTEPKDPKQQEPVIKAEPEDTNVQTNSNKTRVEAKADDEDSDEDRVSF